MFIQLYYLVHKESNKMVMQSLFVVSLQIT